MPLSAAMPPQSVEDDSAADGAPPYAPSLSELLIDAISGVGFPTMAIAIEAENTHYAFFDALIENWRWSQPALAKLPEAQLQNLYANLKEAQHGVS